MLISNMVARAENVGKRLTHITNRNTPFKGESLKPVPGLKFSSTSKHLQLSGVSPVML